MIPRLLKPLAISALLGLPVLHAQKNPTTSAIVTDALVFHGPSITDKEMVDVYVSVPYQALQFQSLDGKYVSQLTAKIIVRDKAGRKVTDTTVKRSIVEQAYNITQGASGASESMVVRFPMRPGTYVLDVTVQDMLAQRDRSVTDTVEVADLSNAPSMSSLLYVSQIEERNGRYVITPYVGSTMWNPELQLFTFFEYYTADVPTQVAFSWSISTGDGRVLGGGLGEPTQVLQRTSQHFIPLRLQEKAKPGLYRVVVLAHPVAQGVVDTTVILATSSREYIVPRSQAGAVLNDITLAIKQLAYIATQEEYDIINGATAENDRLYRFEEFWKKHDPTPSTVRNEAFEEYYARIATANQQFKSYADGWMTDMGRVYVIYGEPSSKDRYTSQNGMVQNERWLYPNNQQFIFEDTGFGDFRLRTPLPPDAKYQFR